VRGPSHISRACAKTPKAPRGKALGLSFDAFRAPCAGRSRATQWASLMGGKRLSLAERIGPGWVASKSVTMAALEALRRMPATAVPSGGWAGLATWKPAPPAHCETPGGASGACTAGVASAGFIACPEG